MVGQRAQSVAHSILYSKDSGNHTCSVTDYVGHTGSASIAMVVSGEYVCKCND